MENSIDINDIDDIRILKEMFAQERQERQRYKEKLTENEKKLTEKSQEIAELKILLKGLQEQVESLQRKIYGKSSEKTSRKPSSSTKKKPKDPAKTKAKRKKNREERNKKLEVEDQVLKPQDLHCEDCGDTDFSYMGEKTSEQIEFVPARLKKIRFHRHTMRCKCGKTIVTANTPPNVKEGVQYGPGLHAHIAVSKASDSLPLERQSAIFARQGVHISPSTLGDIANRTGNLLEPIVNHIKKEAINAHYLSADETTMPMHPNGIPIEIIAKKEKKKRRGSRDACHKAWIWVFVSKRSVYYYFALSRKQAVVDKILGNTEGILMVDGYTGYNHVSHSVSSAEDHEKQKSKEPSFEKQRIRAGCNGHARRKFFDTPVENKDADWFIEEYSKLYQIEEEAVTKGIVGTSKHLKLRQSKSKALMYGMKGRVESLEGSYGPNSKMGKALTYFKNQWDRLSLFLEDPLIPLDNNISEQTMRKVALGRKNFLFVGNLNAGRNLANIFTVVETCRLHDVNPEPYIADVLIRMQTHPASDINDLMPWNWKRLFGNEAVTEK